MGGWGQSLSCNIRRRADRADERPGSVPYVSTSLRMAACRRAQLVRGSGVNENVFITYPHSSSLSPVRSYTCRRSTAATTRSARRSILCTFTACFSSAQLSLAHSSALSLQSSACQAV